MYSNNQISRLSAIREIIGKSTNCLTKFVFFRHRYGLFDPITLTVNQQLIEIFFAYHSAI